MNLNRRQVLGGIFGVVSQRFPISGLAHEAMEVLNIPDIPTEKVGIMKGENKNTLSFIKRALKIGIPQSTIDDFLSEREVLIRKSENIGRRLLHDLGITDTEKHILISSRVPSSDYNDPTKIQARWGYPEMTWKDFFSWEGRHTIKGSYELESGVELPCSAEGVEANGDIKLEFTPQGIIKLILRVDKKSPDLTSSSSQGIEIIVKNTQEIQEQIFKWKSRDWSQDIIREHTETQERMREIFEQKGREARKNKVLNILKGSTMLTKPETAINKYNKTASI